MTWLWILVLIPVALVGCGVAYQAWGISRDRKRFPPPGALVDTPRGRFHVYSTGTEGPVILLEAGIAATSLSWRAVQDRLSAHARVVSYDRAGYGWSPPKDSPLDLENLVEDLRAVVDSIRSDGPIAFVGHSFGGLLVRHYASRFPKRAAGLVLLDPLEPHEWHPLSEVNARRLARGVLLSRRGALLARVGVVRSALDLLLSGARVLPKWMALISSGRGSGVADRLVGEVRKMPEAVWRAVCAHWCSPDSFLTMAEYLKRLPESCALTIRDGALRDTPLTVISAETSSEHVIEAHRRTAQASRLGSHLIAAGSGHWVMLDRPELVAEEALKIATLQRTE